MWAFFLLLFIRPDPISTDHRHHASSFIPTLNTQKGTSQISGSCLFCIHQLLNLSIDISDVYNIQQKKSFEIFSLFLYLIRNEKKPTQKEEVDDQEEEEMKIKVNDNLLK